MALNPLDNASTPENMPQVTPPRSSDANAYMMQAVFELNNMVGKIDARTTSICERLDAIKVSIDTSNDKVEKLAHQVSLAKGFMMAAVLLIPICSTIVWWAIGSRIENALNQAPVTSQNSRTETE